MTPAFQVLICLCMLGLSFAAPKPRDIRWCVTSETEVKKCNDQAKSCSVNGFVLKCVKKSSTEDCMKAISDGQADAISLNNEQVHKASLNPFNLRPIMTGSHSQRDQGPCQKERQALLGAGRPLLGAFVPECDEKGNYIPKQCHGSTGYCWCVNEEGKEIDGTKTSPGQPSQTCEDSAAKNQGPCQKERQALLGASRPLLGAFVPECDEKGNYIPKQCHGSTGYCWCVNEEGKEIDGTKTSPGQPSQTCEDSAAKKSTPCLRHRQRALGEGKKPIPIGEFVPECNDDGHYVPKQCHGSTGHCWCVNKDGEEIEGSRAGPGKAPVICEDAATDTPCLKERQKILGEKTPSVGRFVPKCDEKGNYSSQQCHGSTGYCWCVNVNGEEIAGTKTPPGQPAQNCAAHAPDTPCLKERQKILGEKTPSVGRFAPKCDEKGNYSSQQCHGSTGYCWCVNVNGEEIAGTKTPPGQPAQNCAAHAPDTPCLKERQKILGEKTPSVGRFVPKCDEKGNYSPQQCHGSTGYCWCVNVNGEEIAGTKTPPGQPAQNCAAHAPDTPCLKERQKILGEKTPSVGRFVPKCDEKGNYSPQQCHGSTGYCWCVNVNGEEIAGTKTPPGQPAQNCAAHAADTPCLKERQKILGEKAPVIGGFVPQCDEKAETVCIQERQKVLGAGQPLPGAFVPDCDEKGNYSPKQCHGSTGYCWCVTKDGQEIQGTRTASGQSPPTCEVSDISAADTPCLKERQKILGEKIPSVGRFEPQCDEKGNYSPQQCHGSTGYCWCVNVNGEEIAGTKTPPGQPAQNCAAHAETVCIKERKKVLGAGQPLPGAFVPDCDEKGNYSPKQCHGSTGYCWCVTKDGQEIQGTRTASGQSPPTCEVTAPDTPCLKERQKILGGKIPSVGRFVPKCDEKGNYSPQQCHGSTGYCWCVNVNGEEIAGTKTPPGQPAQNCAAHEQVPTHSVVTRSNGDKTKDITEYLLEAQKKQCKLFS
ncbi:thyroglobulin-like [Hyla sarda]|uniref:thyroglobulin-like n=1 Tax=Hyla sarda TaxID=327740 RepID=UPI0024C3573B|nr:thyroglobulin-like [Hyla sarda]